MKPMYIIYTDTPVLSEEQQKKCYDMGRGVPIEEKLTILGIQWTKIVIQPQYDVPVEELCLFLPVEEKIG